MINWEENQIVFCRSTDFLKEEKNLLIQLKEKSGKDLIIDCSLNILPLKSIKFIEDFNKAIQSNICISRKSTILLEAVYNQSKSIALLVDPQDKFEFENIFPALLDTRIYKCFSFEKLIKQLNKN